MTPKTINRGARSYWFVSGLFWGIPIGVGAALVSQAYSWNVSAGRQFEQTQLISEGLSKTNLILTVLTSGERDVVVDRDGAKVMLSTRSGGQKFELSRTEQVLLAWSAQPNDSRMTRNRQHLIDAISEDHHYGTETISPLSVQQFLAFAAQDTGRGQERWIDDPTVMSVLTQDLTRRFTSQLSREAEMSLWPRIARCIVTVDPTCWNKTLRQGGHNEKGAGEPTPVVFPPVPKNQTAGN